MLIEGLHIDVPGTEVRDILTKKAEHHAQRHLFYVNELSQLELALGGVPNERERRFSGGHTDPRDSFRAKIKQHARLLKHTRFLAAHVVPDAIYRLSTGELDRLGLLDPDEEEAF